MTQSKLKLIRRRMQALALHLAEKVEQDRGPAHVGPTWFDFDNTPHVLFLEPLLRDVETAGHRCLVTCRDQSQTVQLAQERRLDVAVVGRGDKKGRLSKIWGVLDRARLLRTWVRPQSPRLLVSCSRSAVLAARSMGVPAIGLLDYEHAEQRTLAWGCDTIWLPDILDSVELPGATARIARFYPGLKENLYLDERSFDRAGTRARFGVADDHYLVVARPPADTAHYASERSGPLWFRCVSSLVRRPEVRMIIVARTAEQRTRLRTELEGRDRIRFLERAVDGPALIAAADLVIGGGGTMNREAAVLGVPVWSVFTGPTPAIDLRLSTEGRLRWVRSNKEAEEALAEDPPERMAGRGPFPAGRAMIMQMILDYLTP